MIGPIPMDDFGGDPFVTGDGTTPNAVLAWQERQRRQRTVRLLMMFLMMLLLMDGEEPNRRRRGDRESNIHLRRGKRGARGGSGGGVGTGGLERMGEELWEARREQDRRVKEATEGHPRRRDVLELNGGKDVEASIKEWAAVEVTREEMELAKGKDEPSEKARAKIAAEKATDEEDTESSKRKVYHYPRNATGYYRGDWKRVDGGAGDEEEEEEGYDDMEGVAAAAAAGASSNGAEDDFEPDVKISDGAEFDGTTATDDGIFLIDERDAEPVLKRRLHKRGGGGSGGGAGVLLLPPGVALRSEATSNNATDAPFRAPGRVSSESGTSSLRSGKPGIAELLGGTGGGSESRGGKRSGPPRLSLTRKSGRTAFQLYARPIPAVSELSVVEGYVKLYDGSSSAFVASTKRDVLLRVRGVVIHSLGRMSLVANAAPGRSALVIDGGGDDYDETTKKDEEKDEGKVKKKKKAKKTKEVKESLAASSKAKKKGGKGAAAEASGNEEIDQDEEEEEEIEEEDRRRRLRAVLSDYLEAEEEKGGEGPRRTPSFGGDGIPGSSFSDDRFSDDNVSYEGGADFLDEEAEAEASGKRSEGLLEQIRDDALSLFEDTNSLGKMKSLWHERSTADGIGGGGAGGWALSSPDFDESDVDYHFDELFYGEPSRQMAELVGSQLGVHGEVGDAEEAAVSSDWWPSLFQGRRSLRVAEEPPEDDVADEAAHDKEARGKEAEAAKLGVDVEADASEEEDGAAVDGKEQKDESESDTAVIEHDGDETGDREDESKEGATELKKSSRRTKASEVPAPAEADKTEPADEDKESKPSSHRIKSSSQTSQSNSDNVIPYPYATDDSAHTLSRAPAQLSRRIPHRELVLESNGLECEFELLFDVKEIRWTVGEWRTMAGRHARDMHDLDPQFAVEEEDDDEKGSSSDGGGKADRVPTVAANAHYRRKKSKPAHDSLAMQLNGTIISPNCAFRSEVNVTAVRTDWEHTTGKAINYSFYMMLTCLTQIVVLLRQMLHTQSPSAAVRVSLLCVGWQTVLDAVLCVGHIFLCLVMQPLFTAFASVAFFKLLIFCVIEMKYMAIVVQARHNASNNAGNDTSAEELRRKVALLHLRFYAALMFATAGFWAFGQKHRILYVLFLYSFWVPQIVCNIITEAKKPLHHYFVYGMSVTRLVAPMYMFAVPNNFMKEVNPDFPTDLLMCELLVLWVGVQAAVLIAQGKYGARFMIPAIFLPPKYDYSRPIPPSMKPPPPPPSETPKPPRNISDDEADGAGAVVVKQRGPRIRKGSGKGKSSGGPRRKNAARVGSEESKGTTMTVSEGTRPPPDAPTLDCVICYNDIDISDRMGYMLAPCDHIFHRTCLEQWMDVKMECPICRKELPAL